MTEQIKFVENPKIPFIPENLVHGLILAAVGLPTESTNSSGKKMYALGAVGESQFAQALANLTNTELITTGRIQREIAASKGYDTEEKFLKFRRELHEKKTYDHDIQVDNASVSKAIAQAGEQGISIVSSKLFSFHIAKKLAEKQTRGENIPAILIIAINADDDVANRRMLLRRNDKTTSLKSIKQQRRIRYNIDKKLYEEIYNRTIPPYTRKQLIKHSHLIVDNSANVREKQVETYITELACQTILGISIKYPEIKDFLHPNRYLQPCQD